MLSSKALVIVTLFVGGILLTTLSFINLSFDNAFRKNTRESVSAGNAVFPAFRGAQSKTPMACFVTRVSSAQIGYLLVLALGLYHTELPSICMLIVDEDSDSDQTRLNKTIALINKIIHRSNFATLVNVRPLAARHTDRFHMMNNILVDFYLKSPRNSWKCEYIIFTEANSFYSKKFGHCTKRTSKEVHDW